MYKFVMVIFTVLLMTVMAFGQVETVWEKSAAGTSLPAWFSTTANTERGFGFGVVNENPRLYVVSRNGGNYIRVIDATNGSDVDTLDVTGVAGGTFAVSDADVSDDGIIFVCNLTTDATASPFRVYRWDTEGGQPTEVITFNGMAARFGDKFTVVGSTADNTVKIFAGAASKDSVVIFTTADNGASFTPTEVALANANQGAPAVGPVDLGDVSYFVNSNGNSAVHYAADGSVIGTIPGGVLATGSNAMRMIKTPTAYYLAAYQYGANNENARIIDVTGGAASASTFGLTTTLGANSNGNGAGDVDILDNGDGTFNVYVLSCNNGFGAYKVTPPNEMFLSQYIEYSFGNNKALEFYNPRTDSLDLADYQIAQASNGAGWAFYHIFPAGAKIGPEDVWVIITDQVDTTLFKAADADEVLAFPSVTHHNGNDARAVIKIAFDDTLLLDVFGDPNSAANFNVAGVAEASKDHTLIRKGKIKTGNPDWASSAGTNATDSEWIVVAETFKLLGQHPVSVKVTFVANTSRIEGVTDTTGGVDLRGSMQGWSAEQDPMMSDGGDYWSLEWTFPDTMIGTTQFYKYGVTVKDYLPPNAITSYWENDAPGADNPASSPNREMVVPEGDMIMPAEYVGHRLPPYTPSDSIDVYFRVNMAAKADFQPESGAKVYLVGAFPGPDGAENMWDPAKYPLTREGPNSPYWGFHLPLAVSGAPYDSTMYRFTTGSWDGSEQIFGHGMFPDNENRGVSIGLNDTTLQWVWWNDQPYQGATGTDTVSVHFLVDMTRALQDKGFAIDDTLLVAYGWNATAVQETDTLINIPLTNRYEVTVEAKSVTAGENLQYQYFRNSDIGDNREIFYDFDDQSGVSGSAERRKLAIPSPAPQTVMEVADVEESETSMRRQPTFANNSLLTKNVTVYWECNLKPAYFQVATGDTLEDGQGDIDITLADLDSIFTWGVWMNGLAVGGWNNPAGNDWGADLRANLDKKMYDDGTTEGDMTAGDSVYTLTWFYSPDSGDVVGQIYKFGLYGGDNEPGKGGFGLNHKANIDDTEPTYTIHTQFGSINPFFYTAWDFDAEGPATAIEDFDDGIVIRTPNLRENYPNPFNPSTTLTFELPKQMEVELVIYDVLGRKVSTLVKGVQRAGVHQVLWNGADERGRSVSSGVYFYRLTTENYTRTLKMVLMR